MMLEEFRKIAIERLSYDPQSGVIRWKSLIRRGGNIKVGEIAGCIKNGYVVIHINGRAWRGHRIAWLMQTGSLPETGYEIDHIDGNRSNNSWSNLRVVNRNQNNYNTGISKANKSGCKGVSYRKDTGKWLARLKLDGKIIHLGYHDSKESAIKARREGEKQFHGQYARIN